MSTFTCLGFRILGDVRAYALYLSAKLKEQGEGGEAMSFILSADVPSHYLLETERGLFF